ncbi:MAG: nuclear transport factor 2 family protein [Pseudomonadota bacterium]
MQLSSDNPADSDDHRKAHVQSFLVALNDAWLEKNYSELYAYFSKDCVLLTPSGSDTLAGVDAMVDSYRQFGELAAIHDFSILNIETFTRSDLAVAHLTYEIDYEIGGERHLEQGMEVYVLSVTGNYHQVVWRTQKSLPDPDYEDT